MLTLEEAKRDYQMKLEQKEKEKKIKTRCRTCIYHIEVELATFIPDEPPYKGIKCLVKDNYVNNLEALRCKYHQNNQLKSSEK